MRWVDPKGNRPETPRKVSSQRSVVEDRINESGESINSFNYCENVHAMIGDSYSERMSETFSAIALETFGVGVTSFVIGSTFIGAAAVSFVTGLSSLAAVSPLVQSAMAALMEMTVGATATWATG